MVEWQIIIEKNGEIINRKTIDLPSGMLWHDTLERLYEEYKFSFDAYRYANQIVNLDIYYKSLWLRWMKSEILIDRYKERVKDCVNLLRKWIINFLSEYPKFHVVAVLYELLYGFNMKTKYEYIISDEFIEKFIDLVSVQMVEVKKLGVPEILENIFSRYQEKAKTLSFNLQHYKLSFIFDFPFVIMMLYPEMLVIGASTSMSYDKYAMTVVRLGFILPEVRREFEEGKIIFDEKKKQLILKVK